MDLNQNYFDPPNQDCWNQIISYKTNFADLKSLRLVSRSMSQVIELCCQNIFRTLDLNDENPPLLEENRMNSTSFKRILALEDLIKKWIKEKQPKTKEEGDPQLFINNLFFGFDLGYARYQNLKNLSEADCTSAKSFVSKELQKLDCNLHSLANFFEFINCTNLCFTSPKSNLVLTIYYFTSFIFKNHLGNEGLKKLVVRNSHYSSLAVEEEDTKTIQKILGKIDTESRFIGFLGIDDVFNILELAIKRVKLKSFEEIINYIREKKASFNCAEIRLNKIKIANTIIQESKQTTLDLFNTLLSKLEIKIPYDFTHTIVSTDHIPLLTNLKQEPIPIINQITTEKLFNRQEMATNETPLHQVKSVEAAKILIEGGSEINKKNSANQTPLKKTLVKIIKIMSKNLLNMIFSKSTYLPRSPQKISNLNNQIEIAKFLITKGAKIDRQDEEMMANIQELSHLLPKKVKAKPNYIKLSLSKLSLIVKAALVDSTFSKFFLDLSSFFERPLGKSIQWYSLTIAKGIHAATLKYFN